jgi:hypothetical protein
MIAPNKTVRRMTTGRDSGTDPILDTMLADALREDVSKEPADTTRAAREFADERGWPVPAREPRKWVRPLLVVLGSIIATLLLGQALEHLRSSAYEPAPLPAATPAPQPTPTSQPIRAPRARPVFQPDPPRAELVRLPPWRVGEWRMVQMLDGRRIPAVYRGGLPSMDALLARNAQPGDAYWLSDSRSLWILTTPIGSTRLSWIDP